MPTLKFAEAIRQALSDEMDADPSVVVMGEEVGALGGVFTVTKDLVDLFGPDRVMDSVLAEGALAGFAAGAASEGMRPVVEIMFSDFVMLAMDQIVNFAAKARYMSNGQFRMPLVVRLPGGGGTNHGPQHSQALESWFAHVPGLVVAMPSTPDDAYRMMRDAIRTDDPVLFFENKALYLSQRGEVETGDRPWTRTARLARQGSEITVVSIGRMVGRCLEAADVLSGEGISCEVVDLRYLWPLDRDTLRASILSTNRLAVVHEAVEFCGWGGEVAGWTADELFEHLDAPVARVGSLRVPIPAGRELEDQVIPTTARIVESLRMLASY
ncbi:alpha-ketoacid dehydrogenase subunit beta [Saccharopolyspora hattusasensis]|uniref:alpha-ketoacid dehydrogenase subunit beta n=1 Tax=Saccharopolyspora hattusasensis TaxID=1128679 RepID=UPI003D99931D